MRRVIGQRQGEGHLPPDVSASTAHLKSDPRSHYDRSRCIPAVPQSCAFRLPLCACCKYTVLVPRTAFHLLAIIIHFPFSISRPAL